MAKATVNYREEAKVVITTVPATVTLELTIQEAEFVKCLVGNVTGLDHQTAREITSKVFYALQAEEIETASFDKYFKGSVYAIPYTL